MFGSVNLGIITFRRVSVKQKAAALLAKVLAVRLTQVSSRYKAHC